MALTEAQKAEMKECVGGSRSPAILGVSRYASAKDVYDDMANPIEQTNAAMQRGHKVEPILAQRRKELYGVELKTDCPTYFHPTVKNMIGHIDGLITSENAIWEAKSCSVYSAMAKEFGEENTDQMPAEYLIQGAHYEEVMKKLGITKVIFDVAFVKDDSGTPESIKAVGTYIYIPNRQLGDHIANGVDKFIKNHIEPRIAPTVESKRKNVIPLESVKIATPEIRRTWSEADRLNKVIKRLEAKYESKKMQLKEYLGEYQYLMDKNNIELANRKVQIVNYKASDAKTVTRDMFRLIGVKDEQCRNKKR